ncbi:MAG: hypothetical protein BWK76_22060 [Desulfobulbaceae bacterium A2]|nr:MAG: hypothetical protein BWK76_22060 [Desulfobulbaceae bacterium A2]
MLPATGRPWLDQLAAGSLERLLGLTRLDHAYRRLGPSDDCDEFIAKACAALDITLHFPASELAHIPADGPVLVVANHPFGGIEGLLLAGLLRRVRPDVRVMANYLLSRIPELADIFIAVDPFGGPRAGNATGLRQSLRWLRDGGVLLVFPAGEVSHWQRGHGAVTDPPWQEGIARLAQLSGARVLPIYLYGNNSLGFHVAGLLHPRLRTALLAKELLNKRNKKVALRIGQAMEPAEYKDLTPAALTQFLRLRTYLLGAMREELASPPALQIPAACGPSAEGDACAREVAALAPEQTLAAAGEFAVYLAHAAQIPSLLREIGRLREQSFRAVGEGTGQDIDLDEFDVDYLHLFVWHTKKNELVGGYRLGLVDHILARRGRKGLYTRQLFRMKKKLFQQMGPAIELGRSFVRTEYQRSFTPLLLLWKGIAAFVVRNPAYCTLFGPVSISSSYSPVSRQLIMDFLQTVELDSELARCVRPRKKPARGQRCWGNTELATLGEIEHISRLLAGFEPDGRGVPVLLRQYLKLGGRILGFNVDENFNDAIDALIMVDLSRCDSRSLERYMGREAARDFLAHHVARRGEN